MVSKKFVAGNHMRQAAPWQEYTARRSAYGQILEGGRTWNFYGLRWNPILAIPAQYAVPQSTMQTLKRNFPITGFAYWEVR